MNGQMTSTPERWNGAWPPTLSRTSLSHAPRPPLPSTPADALQQVAYRERLSKCLGDLNERLFAEFTGAHFHVIWAPSLSVTRRAHRLPDGCSLCCRMARSSVRWDCLLRGCGARHLAATLESTRGHRFTCRLGIGNYWLPLRVRNVTAGIACLQALEDFNNAPAVATKSPLPLCANRSGVNRADDRFASRASKVLNLNRSEFNRAARLLRFVVQHAETSVEAELGDAELVQARNAAVTFEKEQLRLRDEINHLLPAIRANPPVPASGRHKNQILLRVLKRIHQDYAQPITLRECAGELQLSPAYLSDLFSRGVGLPFKRYLTEMRLEKAKALLSSPQRNLADVARAVGYASENRFRIAFRKSTGLPPRLWRETVQMNPPEPPS